MTSCVVLICTLTFGLDRDLSEPGNLNGKYRSIDFAHRQRMKRNERYFLNYIFRDLNP